MSVIELNVTKAAVKRRVLSIAAKMNKDQINSKVNELLRSWERKKEMSISPEEVELELACWSEIWLSRK